MAKNDNTETKPGFNSLKDDSTKALPYLPQNKDFSDSIRVIHVLCQIG